MSRNFVIKWTKSLNQNFEEDNRGWPKGKMRKYTKQDIRRIEIIHDELTKDKDEFFAGATAIAQKWRKKHSSIKVPHLRFIGRVLKDTGRSEKIHKGKNKGASKYLHYPKYSINQLGERLLEIDFIGKKFIKGRTEPLNFIGFSLRKPRKLKHFKRITGETGDNIIKESERFFKKFEKPDVVKMDNSFAASGSGYHKRTLSDVIIYYLTRQIISVFAPPRKPWSQASIEGSNSVFSRKFWNRIEFKSPEHVDERLTTFNDCYQRYSGYKPPKKRSKQKDSFTPKIYFIRKVYECKDLENDKGYIDITNQKISIPKSYINLFTLSEWNLKKEQLSIYFEKEQKLKLIKKISFKIHPKSKERLHKELSK